MGKYSFVYNSPNSRPTVHLEDAHGVAISEDQKERMIEEGLEHLALNPDEAFWITATGDTFIYLYRDLGDDPDFIEITVSEVKRHGTAWIKTINKAPSLVPCPPNVALPHGYRLYTTTDGTSSKEGG